MPRFSLSRDIADHLNLLGTDRNILLQIMRKLNSRKKNNSQTPYGEEVYGFGYNPKTGLATVEIATLDKNGKYSSTTRQKYSFPRRNHLII